MIGWSGNNKFEWMWKAVAQA